MRERDRRREEERGPDSVTELHTLFSPHFFFHFLLFIFFIGRNINTITEMGWNITEYNKMSNNRGGDRRPINS